ncbi:MAG: hypothetical protein JWN33_125 [Candidatus Saccharibacteria bacterium]|nr:hypothetical protein [Candidatus Saccharibacteria bacterium]
MSVFDSMVFAEIDELTPTHFQEDHHQLPVRAAEVVLDGGTGRSERLFDVLLPLLRDEIHIVEFARGVSDDGELYICGALLRREDGTVVIHIKDAAIGYHGSGADLSRHVLTALNVPSDVFEKINEKAQATRRPNGTPHYDIVLRLHQ